MVTQTRDHVLSMSLSHLVLRGACVATLSPTCVDRSFRNQHLSAEHLRCGSSRHCRHVLAALMLALKVPCKLGMPGTTFSLRVVDCSQTRGSGVKRTRAGPPFSCAHGKYVNLGFLFRSCMVPRRRTLAITCTAEKIPHQRRRRKQVQGQTSQ